MKNGVWNPGPVYEQAQKYGEVKLVNEISNLHHLSLDPNDHTDIKNNNCCIDNRNRITTLVDIFNVT
jgi:hypothetical protein